MLQVLAWKIYTLVCAEEEVNVDLDVKALGFLLIWGGNLAATAFLIFSSGLQRSNISTTSLTEGLLIGSVLVHSRSSLSINFIYSLWESTIRESMTLLSLM